MTAISALGLLGIPFPFRTIAAKSAAATANAGALGNKRREQRQWFTLPNGIRVYASYETFQALQKRHALEEKRVERRENAEQAEVAVGPVAEEGEPAADPSAEPVLRQHSTVNIQPLLSVPSDVLGGRDQRDGVAADPARAALSVLAERALRDASTRAALEEAGRQAQAQRRREAEEETAVLTSMIEEDLLNEIVEQDLAA